MPESRSPQAQPADRDLMLDLARVISCQMTLQEIPEGAWPEISRLALRNGLGPLLWWILQQPGQPVSPSAAWIDLENSYKIAAFTHQLMQENQSLVDHALAQAVITAIWFKGMSLAQTLYPQPQLRPMDDLDVLVPYAQRQAALHMALSNGYHLLSGNILEQKLPDPESIIHHYRLKGGSTGKIILEIHFRLISDDKLLPLNEMDWFFQEKEMLGQGEAAFTVLKPEAQFLYLCSHAILQHGESAFRLQWYYDLHLLAIQPRMNWDLVVKRANELGWAYTVARALDLTRHYFATPIPEQVLISLNNYQSSDKDYIRARRLQGAGHRWETRSLQLSELTWGERMRQLFHLTFPPAEYMRTKYAIPAGRSLLPYYIFRWWDAAGQIIAATLRRFR